MNFYSYKDISENAATVASDHRLLAQALCDIGAILERKTFKDITKRITTYVNKELAKKYTETTSDGRTFPTVYISAPEREYYIGYSFSVHYTKAERARSTSIWCKDYEDMKKTVAQHSSTDYADKKDATVALLADAVRMEKVAEAARAFAATLADAYEYDRDDIAKIALRDADLRIR